MTTKDLHVFDLSHLIYANYERFYALIFSMDFIFLLLNKVIITQYIKCPN